MTAIGFLTLTLTLAPATAIVLILLIRRSRASEGLNLAASAISLLSILGILTLARGNQTVFWGGYVVIDSIGGWTILCAAVVYFLASLYAIGYMRMLGEDDRLHRFYAMFAGFALSTLVGPMMNNAGLYWIAIELTTLISTFLVAFEREATSIEAAWKYIIVVSAGISLALLGTVLFYWSGTFVLGQTYDMTWQALEQMAPRLNPPLVSLSFLLVLIGYGTKVGLAPMHTWLPDAHSEGPAPVSALLSGALLNTAMVGIVRYLVVADAAGITSLAHGALLGLGAFSLFVARSLHRPSDRNQAADGLLQRRAHGRDRAGLWLRRPARHRGSALSYAQSLAEQISDVLRRRERHAGLWDETDSWHPWRAPQFSGAGRPMASLCRRHYGRASVRAISQRVDHHSRRTGGILSTFSWG